MIAAKKAGSFGLRRTSETPKTVRPRRFGLAGRWLAHLAGLWAAKKVARLYIRMNPRLSRTLGRCLPATAVIEVAPSVTAASDPPLKEVIAHEAAHFVVSHRHGRSSRPHGPEWRDLVERAGFAPVASRVRCGERRASVKSANVFLHICPVCGFSRRARRCVPTWRCPECRAIGLEGALRVERVGIDASR